MNVKSTAEILVLSSAALREYAKELGVKRAASDTKVTLQAKVETAAHKLRSTEEVIVTPITRTTEQTLAVLAQVAKAPSRLCDICGKRRLGGASSVPGMCALCYEEGGWENTHTDWNHSAVLEIAEADRTVAQNEEIQGCWICFPELNLAQREVVKRITKAGMKILAKGSYIHKSQLVAKAIEALGGKAEVRNPVGDRHVLTADVELAGIGVYAIVCEWNGNAFDYAESSLNGKKFRNVKELLRTLGVTEAQI